jgi:serine/threonine protein phosphatase PrpC
VRLGHNIGHGSHAGRVRSLNEDYHRVCQFPLIRGELTLLAVADGMGGAAAGEVASKLAVEVVVEAVSRYAEALREGKPVIGVDKLIDKAIRLANRRVYAQALLDPGRQGMGTTLTAVALADDKAYMGHVGDSRAYLVRGDKIYQLTKDHSWVEEQLDKGLLTPQEAEVHEWRNLITRALGTRLQVAPDLVELEVKRGDVLVLSSDGLHNAVAAEEILAEVRRGANRAVCADSLIELANERGGHDNITVVVAEVL